MIGKDNQSHLTSEPRVAIRAVTLILIRRGCIDTAPQAGTVQRTPLLRAVDAIVTGRAHAEAIDTGALNAPTQTHADVAVNPRVLNVALADTVHTQAVAVA
jgi:hypothetical protein